MIETQILQREIALAEYVPACIDVGKFIKFCEECPAYSRNWACPPFNFSPMNIWLSYKSILLYGRKVVFGEELANKQYEADELNSLIYEIMTPIKANITEELLEMERGNHGSRALFAGKCEGCEICNRPTGQACIRPEFMRHSIEALGGDVEKTLKLYFDEKLVWTSAGRLPQHFFLLGGLLIG